MKIIGLTGGIGSGKSAVAEILSELGARVIDADVIAREVVAIGSIGLGSIVDRFGEDVLEVDGSLNRLRLAELVFSDVEALGDLNRITHPLIASEIQSQLKKLLELGFDGLVVLVIPLLNEDGPDRYGFSEVVVVDVDPEVALDRLVNMRHMSEADARARIAAQIDRTRRLDIATEVIENSGTLAELKLKTMELFERLLKQ